MNWYLDCWTKSFDYTGRASRNEFWHFMLYACAICLFVFTVGKILLVTAIHFFPSHAPMIISLANQTVSFFFFIHVFPIVSVQTRRLHDIGMSGWWQFITIIALISGITFQIAIQLAPKGAAMPGWLWIPLLLLATCYLFLLALNCKAGDKGPNRYGKSARGTPQGR